MGDAHEAPLLHSWEGEGPPQRGRAVLGTKGWLPPPLSEALVVEEGGRARGGPPRRAGDPDPLQAHRDLLGADRAEENPPHALRSRPGELARLAPSVGIDPIGVRLIVDQDRELQRAANHARRESQGEAALLDPERVSIGLVGPERRGRIASLQLEARQARHDLGQVCLQRERRPIALGGELSIPQGPASVAQKARQPVVPRVVVNEL